MIFLYFDLNEYIIILFQGTKGEPGLQPRRGEPGAPGATGPEGEKGDRGFTGQKGEPGLRGEVGEKGDRGLTGLEGRRGLQGVRGEIGLTGPAGLDGRPGPEGPKGDRGSDCSASPDYLSGQLLVKHSQSRDVPECDNGHIKVWDGYSLLYIDGNDYPHNQDLGSPGSCVRKFSTLPVLACGPNNVCNYASRNDRSFWLSTSAPMPMMPIADDEIVDYISRCAVCEVPANVIAVHSQILAVPECPIGWESLWIGYSFAMVRLLLNVYSKTKHFE